MRRRRGMVSVMAAAIALLLLGAVAGVARVGSTSVNVSTAAAGTGSTTEEPAEPLPVDTTVTTAAPEAVTPADAATTTAPVAGPSETTSTTIAAPSEGGSGIPVGGNHRDQPRGPGEVGSVADVGPGAVERTAPAPCTPSAQATGAHAIAVVELRLGCVRALVPAGTWVGTEVGWSPDGTWLLATVKGRVVRLARDGSWRQDLGGGEQARLAVLSPDGTRMAVVGAVPHGNLSQKDVVVVASSDGSGARTIDGRAVRAPSWSPDSQVLGIVTNVGGPGVPDVLRLVGADGRERATRTFTGRALGGPQGTDPVAAPLGRPTFLPDGRIFQPAFVELPRQATGLWLNRSLQEVGGLPPPGDLSFNDGVTVPADGASMAYTGFPGTGQLGMRIREVDLASGQAVTLASGSVPGSSHRSKAVAFFATDALGEPHGVSVVEAAGGARPVWRHGGTSCTCLQAGPPAWTGDDAAIGVVSSGG